MSDPWASTKIIRDISLLYELSLSVGQSLDLRTNCDAFVRTLLARKNLAYGAVWVKDEHLSGDGNGEWATLVYANPEFRAGERRLSLRHPLFARIADAAVFSVGSASPDFADLLTERDVSHGAFAVFALGDLGVLKLLSLASDEPWSASELNQLRSVIAKFAVSLEGCLVHSQLADEVAERKRAEAMLQRRARQIELGAAIAQQIAALAASDVLFRRVVDLIRDELGYSSAHIFGYDSIAEEMVLVEGSGTVGERIKAAGFRLPYGRGVVGTAAVTREPVLVPDVAAFAGFVAHPDLPETQCELAVPIVLDQELLGVLDVQSDTANALTEEDQLVLEGLANQVANAVRNGRLLRQAEAALDEVEAANRRYLRDQWVDFVPQRAASAHEYAQAGAMLSGGEGDDHGLGELLSPSQLDELDWAVKRAMTAQETVTMTEARGGTDQAALVVPVRLRGEVIGALGFRTPQGEHQWTSEDVALVQAVADQMALAIENARLLDDTQRGEARERTVAEATGHMRQPLELDDVLRTAADEIQQVFGAEKVVVRLAAPETDGGVA